MTCRPDGLPAMTPTPTNPPPPSIPERDGRPPVGVLQVHHCERHNEHYYHTCKQCHAELSNTQGLSREEQLAHAALYCDACDTMMWIVHSYIMDRLRGHVPGVPVDGSRPAPSRITYVLLKLMQHQFIPGLLCRHETPASTENRHIRFSLNLSSIDQKARQFMAWLHGGSRPNWILQDFQP